MKTLQKNQKLRILVVLVLYLVLGVINGETRYNSTGLSIISLPASVGFIFFATIVLDDKFQFLNSPVKKVIDYLIDNKKVFFYYSLSLFLLAFLTAVFIDYSENKFIFFCYFFQLIIIGICSLEFYKKQLTQV